MAIDLHCRCGHEFSVPDEKAGSLTACPICEAMIFVTAPAAPDGAIDLGDDDRAEEEQISRDLVTDEMIALREERISPLPIATGPDTGPLLPEADEAPVSPTGETVTDTQPPAPPDADEAVVAGPEQSADAPRDGGYSVSYDDRGAVEERTYERCPQCDAPLDEGSVVCTACGYNVQTGERVSLVAVEEAGPGAVGAAAEVSLGFTEFLSKWAVKLRYAIIALAILAAGIIVISRFVARQARRHAYLAEVSGGGMVGDWWQAAQKAVEREAYDLEERTREKVEMAMMKLNAEPRAEQGVFCRESTAMAELAYMDARRALVYDNDVRRAERILTAVEVLYGAMEPWGRRAREELARIRTDRAAAASRPASRPTSRPERP